MAGSVKDLAKYRYECASENLETAKELISSGHYKAALNRSYYSIFDALRAVNALDGFDSRKHSGVIAHFNQYHVKTGEFPRAISQMIRRASEMRENADYEDFFVASGQEAEDQVRDAEYVLGHVADFLEQNDVNLQNGSAGDRRV